MLLKTKSKPIIEESYPIGNFLFYPSFIVSEFNEGVHVTKDNAAGPIVLAQEIYGKYRPIVYISHRINSYSVDPLGYKEVSEMFPNFIGFAIVTENRNRRMLANLERLFIKRPLNVFSELETAFEWAETLLDIEEKS